MCVCVCLCVCQCVCVLIIYPDTPPPENPPRIFRGKLPTDIPSGHAPIQLHPKYSPENSARNIPLRQCLSCQLSDTAHWILFVYSL